MNAEVVLGLLGGAVTLGVLLELLRRRRLREKYALFWVVVALLTILVAAFPVLLHTAADLLGVEVPSNLLFFVASMVLMVVSIQHSHELGRLEERTRTLAEEVALLHLRLDLQDAPAPTETAPERR
ncbi:DUF2304 domain-containing protein [Nocardioides caldifontis]|uniref:DUF2304 domain-containing protein n=1 Tax=Nocardioides caldifontis TaxID=2588938 RepID=UPI0011DF01AC|nr:DUF2304 domain-containing protein [Nocardioides caldifontis]